MHNYNNFLYHVVLIQVMTLYIIKLCNCSPDCMYVIMYFSPHGLWPSVLNKLSCLVIFSYFLKSGIKANFLTRGQKALRILNKAMVKPAVLASTCCLRSKMWAKFRNPYCLRTEMGAHIHDVACLVHAALSLRSNCVRASDPLPVRVTCVPCTSTYISIGCITHCESSY